MQYLVLVVFEVKIFNILLAASQTEVGYDKARDDTDGDSSTYVKHENAAIKASLSLIVSDAILVGNSHGQVVVNPFVDIKNQGDAETNGAQSCTDLSHTEVVVSSAYVAFLELDVISIEEHLPK